MPDVILSVSDLVTTFKYGEEDFPVVNGVSFDVCRAEILGIVGESGCGKSVTSLSIMRLIDASSGTLRGGKIIFSGRDLAQIPLDQMYTIRGKDIAMIFQEPMTSLNPLHTVGKQIAEALLLHTRISRAQAWQKAVDMLSLVGIASPEKRAKAYPHMLSGGMRQRVMIAMALCLNPSVLIADEPTTALDVTVQAQILELIKKLRDAIGMAVVLITHDLGVVAEICERVLVMYAGEIVEQAHVAELFQSPLHPYTEGLIRSVPRMDCRQESLHTIAGSLPAIDNMPSGCRFQPRCPQAVEKCKNHKPPVFSLGSGRQVACWLRERVA